MIVADFFAILAQLAREWVFLLKKIRPEPAELTMEHYASVRIRIECCKF